MIRGGVRYPRKRCSLVCEAAVEARQEPTPVIQPQLGDVRCSNIIKSYPAATRSPETCKAPSSPGRALHSRGVPLHPYILVNDVPVALLSPMGSEAATLCLVSPGTLPHPGDAPHLPSVGVSGSIQDVDGIRQ